MRATILIIVGLVMAMAGVGGVDVSPDLMSMVQSTVISIVGVVLMWIGTSWISEQTELTVIELRHDSMKTRRRQHQNS
jgi:arginine exporter protein ArgO